MPCIDPSNTKPIWKFEIDRPLNNGTMSISDELIDSEAIATERATSEFLKNGYTTNLVSFVTGRNDLYINAEISIDSKLYKVKGISLDINSVRSLQTILAVRYD